MCVQGKWHHRSGPLFLVAFSPLIEIVSLPCLLGAGLYFSVVFDTWCTMRAPSFLFSFPAISIASASSFRSLFTKTLFVEYTRCKKSAYWHHHNNNNRKSSVDVSVPDRAKWDLGTRQRMEVGTRLGEIAREACFPGGTLIAALDSADAMADTAAAMQVCGNEKPIYEAAFTTPKGLHARVDILVPIPSSTSSFIEYDLVEVKMSTKVKKSHVSDIHFQRFVLREVGVNVRKCKLLLVDRSFKLGEQHISNMFREIDVSSDVATIDTRIAFEAEKASRMFSSSSVPEGIVGRHCSQPWKCAFWNECHSSLPFDHVARLSRASPKLLRKLQNDAIDRIRDIPVNYDGISDAQRDIVRAVRDGTVVVASALPRVLGELSDPLHFLDFETLQPAIPLFRGTSPYETVPFQWSMHTIDGDQLHHCDFIHSEATDPRKPFLLSLFEALSKDSGPIVVYSSYEERILRYLLKVYPSYEPGIRAIVDRLFDLEKMVRKHVVHPMCLGSSSLKAVLPAFVPSLTYDDITVQEGASASAAYECIATGALDDDHTAREKTLNDLKEYCKRDTLAMVRLHQSLLLHHQATEQKQVE